MFKIFFKLCFHVRRKVASTPFKPRLAWALGLVLLVAQSACLTAPPLAKVNLSEPGWTVRNGQAIWKPKKDAPEIAGELLLATRADGSAFAQFTKTPFPFAVAQMSPKGWQIEFPPQNRHFAAPGKPPARIVWFQLIDAELGKPLAKGWVWKNSDANWQLKNAASGESLEGYFTQ